MALNVLNEETLLMDCRCIKINVQLQYKYINAHDNTANTGIINNRLNAGKI